MSVSLTPCVCVCVSLCNVVLLLLSFVRLECRIPKRNIMYYTYFCETVNSARFYETMTSLTSHASQVEVSKRGVATIKSSGKV